jgi:hypothetical protein
MPLAKVHWKNEIIISDHIFGFQWSHANQQGSIQMIDPTKILGMSPLVEWDELALLVGTLPFGYGAALLVGRKLGPDASQLKIQLQRIADDGRAATPCCFRLFLDQ